MKKKLTDSSVICIVAAVLMLVAIFLPYAVARADFRAMIQQLPQSELESMLQVSMVKFVKIYTSIAEGVSVAKFCGTLVGIMAVAAVAGGVLAFLKKPAPLLFCNVLAFAAFYLHNGNYTNRGVVPSWEYRYGIGYYLFFVAAIVSVAGAIWMLRERKKDPEPEKEEEE